MTMWEKTRLTLARIAAPEPIECRGKSCLECARFAECVEKIDEHLKRGTRS